MRVAFTWYPRGEREQTAWFDRMPVLPRPGDRVYFNDQFWTVKFASLVPDSDEEITPTDTGWHGECSVQ